jgi:hypothetical protein
MATLACLVLESTCAAPQHAPHVPPAQVAMAPCPRPTTADDPADEASGRAAIVIVLDGARWQEIFLGVDPALARKAGAPAAALEAPMPHLRALAAARGVTLGAPGSGSVVRASGPNFVSLPGYTELFTGRAPSSCQSNDCARTTLPTVADEVRACARSPRDVAVFASWPEIERAATSRPSSFVVSTGRHLVTDEPILREDRARAALLDAGAAAGAWPGDGDFRPDALTAALATRYLATEKPRFLFVGLGEADEYAHRGDYVGYLGALRTADDAIDTIVRTLDGMGERGRKTSVFVTADHGRAAGFREHGGEFPESARVWLVGLNGGIAPRAAGRSDGDLRLADLAPTVRASVGLVSVRPRGGVEAGEGRVIDALLPADESMHAYR